MTGYEQIKQLAKKLKCNISDLLVLARQNDPFFSGAPASAVYGGDSEIYPVFLMGS